MSLSSLGNAAGLSDKDKLFGDLMINNDVLQANLASCERTLEQSLAEQVQESFWKKNEVIVSTVVVALVGGYVLGANSK